MLELIASSTFGLESIVKDELWKLGFEIINVENGQISFRADFYGLAKANLWLRCAERVFLKMGEFPARDFDELYDKHQKSTLGRVAACKCQFPCYRQIG